MLRLFSAGYQQHPFLQGKRPLFAISPKLAALFLGGEPNPD